MHYCNHRWKRTATHWDVRTKFKTNEFLKFSESKHTIKENNPTIVILPIPISTATLTIVASTQLLFL